MFTKRRHNFAFSLLILFALLSSTRLYVKAQANKVPLTHEAMWAMKRVGAPAPSPDGKWVVF